MIPDGAAGQVSALMPRGYVDIVEASKAGYAAQTLTKGDTNNISPRVGFAWRPGSGNQSVVRGGFGIYYDASAIGPAAGSTVPFQISEPAYTNPTVNPLVLPVAFPASSPTTGGGNARHGAHCPGTVFNGTQFTTCRSGKGGRSSAARGEWRT